MEHLKLVIVGHVDHGKSTLIGRLLYDTGSLPEGKMQEIERTCKALGRDIEFAYVMDHLQEEREQSITIDTAQTFFKTGRREYVIIDAPGHKEFVKNMITGASQAEAAILIVDAEEGVQEQTKRHAYILGMLGLKQVIAVLNKMDKVGYGKERFEEVKASLLEFLEAINIKPTYVIPISAKEGDNVARKSEKMPWFDGMSILESLDTFVNTERHTEKPLRYPIQDIYMVGGDRVFAGRVESGRIREGQEVTVLPDPRKTKVTGIKVFMDDGKKEAEAGESIGVTIKDKLFLDRGSIICDGRLPEVTDTVSAKVFWMGKQPLKKTDRVTIKLATEEVDCGIESIDRRLDSSTLEVLEEDAPQLNENEVGEMVIKTVRPIVVENFNEVPELGRFVIVQGYDVAAGGIIVE
ncbi:MAG: GTP-binding protein [Candidatus Altiarchaeota archaeon]